MEIERFFGELFLFLDSVGYSWQPLIPSQLIKNRERKDCFSKLDQYFGLGIEMSAHHLELEGLSSDLIRNTNSLRLAVSRFGGFYIPHNHWPSALSYANDYVHFGQESLLLLHQLYRYWPRFEQKRILDLGCGSGALALELSQIAKEVLGLDSCGRAIEWAIASALAQRQRNIHFFKEEVGNLSNNSHPNIDQLSLGSWDIVVYNPPMAVPKKSSHFPHRDGGILGVELPLLFLDFSEHCLKPQGEVFCLMTNPIQRGKSILFEQLKKRDWVIKEQLCLNEKFNHELSKSDQYKELGIDRIELYFLYLKKTKKSSIV